MYCVTYVPAPSKLGLIAGLLPYPVVVDATARSDPIFLISVWGVYAAPLHVIIVGRNVVRSPPLPAQLFTELTDCPKDVVAVHPDVCHQ